MYGTGVPQPWQQQPPQYGAPLQPAAFTPPPPQQAHARVEAPLPAQQTPPTLPTPQTPLGVGGGGSAVSRDIALVKARLLEQQRRLQLESEAPQY